MSQRTKRRMRIQQGLASGELTAESSRHHAPSPLEDTLSYARNYAREKPEIAALWCFGIGFILGWKLKPW